MNKKKFLVYLPVILCPFILFGPALLRGEVLYWGTPALQFIPWRGVAWDMIASGILPLWNPLNGMGAPLLANYQLALFYPPGWILFGFYAAGSYPWLGWGSTLLVVLHLGWAAIGMWNVSRLLGGSELAGIVSALAFSLSGYFVSRAGFFSIIWTGAWLPWMILFSRRILHADPADRQTFRFPISLVVSITFMLLAGHAQLSWYILVLTFFWLFLETFFEKGSKAAGICSMYFILACLWATALSAVQLLPTYEYLQQSQRASAVEMMEGLSYSLWPWRFITFLAPDFFGNPGLGDYWGYGNYWEDSIYIGVLPFLLALSTIPLLVRKKLRTTRLARQTILLWTFAIGSTLLALGKFTPVFVFLYHHIPTFDMFNAPARIMISTIFSLAILAGIGVDYWQKPSGRGLYWLRLATAGGFAVTLGALLSLFLLDTVESTFIRSSAIAGVWVLATGGATLLKPETTGGKGTGYWNLLVVVLVGLDLITSMWNVIPVVDFSFYQKEGAVTRPIRDLIGDGRLFLPLKDEYQIKFFRFLRFNDFRPIEPVENMRIAMLPNLNLLDGLPSANNFDPLVPARFSRWMEYVGELPKEQINPWLRRMNVSLLELYAPLHPSGMSFLPVEGGNRVWWSPCRIVASGEEDAFSALKTEIANREDLTHVIIETDGEELQEQSCTIPKTTTLHSLRENPLQIEIVVQSATPGWMVLSDVWYPGWLAFVDGKPQKIYRADFLFRAVYLTAGIHRVTFQYKPKSFYVGSVLSLASLICLMVLFLIRRRRVFRY